MQNYRTAVSVLVRKHTSSLRIYSSKSSFASRGPSPPQLDPEEQKEFEKLQQAANTQIAIEQYNEDNGFDSGEAPPKVTSSDVGTFGRTMQTIAEFEGDTNPKTGEVNGPKQDPIRHGDWSFNGKVTDF